MIADDQVRNRIVRPGVAPAQFVGRDDIDASRRPDFEPEIDRRIMRERRDGQRPQPIRCAASRLIAWGTGRQRIGLQIGPGEHPVEHRLHHRHMVPLGKDAEIRSDVIQRDRMAIGHHLDEGNELFRRNDDVTVQEQQDLRSGQLGPIDSADIMAQRLRIMEHDPVALRAQNRKTFIG